MFRVYGLTSHIAANRARSLMLLAAFAVLCLMLSFALTLLFEAQRGGSAAQMFARALAAQRWGAPIALGAVAIWFLIAWRWHRSMIASATGAADLASTDAPRLHHLLETLCISRGLRTPRLAVIETPALNAYASGLTEAQATITVTRGLIDQLDDHEIEAVLAHELTHLRNKDTQLLVVALIFAGVFGFVGELMVRNFDGVLASRPRLSSSSDRDDRSKDGAAALIVTIIAFALIALSWGLSILARYALSQTREFMADAGAVELTKNPDALISALRKIERHAVVPGVASSMAAFFIEAPQAAGASALLSTHPTMQDRVDALVDHAGGRDLIGPPLSEPASQMETAPQAEPVSQETASQTSPQSIASAPSPAADLVGVGPRVGADLLSAPPPANSGPWGLVVPPNQTAARTARDV